MQPAVPTSAAPISGGFIHSPQSDSDGSSSTTDSSRQSPAIQTASNTSLSKTVAGHSVTQVEQALQTRQIPQTEHQGVISGRPMMAPGNEALVCGTHVVTSLASNPAMYTQMGGGSCVNPFTRASSEGFHQVAPCNAESTVNQGYIRLGYGAFSQGVTLTHAETMQSSSSLGVSRPPAMATPLPAGGIGPIPHSYHHDQKPYARPPVGATVNQEVKKVGVQQQTSAQGSIVRGTPVVSGQQFYGNDVTDSSTYGSDQSGMSDITTSKKSTCSQEVGGGSVDLAAQSESIAGVSSVSPALDISVQRWVPFMRKLHETLAIFLGTLADVGACSYVERSMNNRNLVCVNMKAFDGGFYPSFGINFVDLLTKEANLQNYHAVQWQPAGPACEEKEFIIVDLYQMGNEMPPCFLI